MLAGKPVTIHGDGADERDYVYVDDVVDAQIAVATKPSARGPYNIGTGVGTNVNDITAMLATECGYEREPHHGPPRPGDVRRISLDPSKATDELAWRPRISIGEGLKRTVAWFRDNP
jgi:UDP-glucose 4-epimerase